MKQTLLKGTAFLFALLAFFALGVEDSYASTGIYIGKDVSAQGTTIVGVAPEGELGMASVPVIIDKGLIRKGDEIESLNGYKYTMPEDGQKIVLEHLMSYLGYGQWNICASNESGVTVAVGFSTDPNIDAVTADPFVSDGIMEDKIPTILASTAKTAKDAVKTLCLIYDETGAAAAGTVIIADQEEAWAVENFTGHEYVATKLPDDMMAAFSNEPIIRTVDTKDTDTVCSSKLLTLPEENGFAVYDDNKNIDLILTYSADNSYSDESHLRGWVGHHIFAPSKEEKYDLKKGYDVFFAPDEKVDLTQAFSFFRNRFEGTEFDLSLPDNYNYWGINNQTVANANVIQIFSDVPAKDSTVLWTTPGNPTASPFVAIPILTGTIPEKLATDAEYDCFDDNVLQFDFVTLNNNVYPRRNVYGKSIRQYWEGFENVSVQSVANSVRNGWSGVSADDYVAEAVESASENCDRFNKELEWYFFRNGVRHPAIADNEIEPFECSFDAVAYAEANGWETSLENGVFTATKDGKTIEVVYEGDNAGSVSFAGFDEKELAADFGSEEAAAGESVEESAKEPEEEPAEESGKPAAETEKEPEKESEKEPAKNPAKTEIKSEPEKVEEESKLADDNTDDLTAQAAKQIEVDTIAELETYFADKIASVPRDGWAENRIATELAAVSDDVVGIIGRHFNGDIDDILNFNDKKAAEVANDPAIPKIGEKIAEAGVDLSGLLTNYFLSLADDVTEDVYAGKITQDGAIRILNEAETDVEGIARLYLEGIAGTFAEVFNTDLSDEELAEVLAELGEGTIQIMEDYGAIDKEALGIDDIDIKDLTEADIDVVITLDAMDEDTLNGLSEILGVDVKATLDAYLEQLDTAAGEKVTIVSEDHDADTAQAGKDEEIKAIKELEETLSEEDIVIPQEVIDILNEAIAEAAGEEEVEPEADTAADTAKDSAPETDSDAEPAPDAETGTYVTTIPNITVVDGRIMVPTLMLKYFK